MGKGGIANGNGDVGSSANHSTSFDSSLTAGGICSEDDIPRKRDPFEGFPEDCGQYPGKNSMPNPMRQSVD